jgi:hypothetical protein
MSYVLSYPINFRKFNIAGLNQDSTSDTVPFRTTYFERKVTAKLLIHTNLRIKNLEKIDTIFHHFDFERIMNRASYLFEKQK